MNNNSGSVDVPLLVMHIYTTLQTQTKMLSIMSVRYVEGEIEEKREVIRGRKACGP